jgi:hypothetical protein
MSSEPSFAAQRAIVAALRGSPAVRDLVPSTSIFDRSGRPETFPCIIIGEGQTLDESDECISAAEVFLDLHVWTKESGFAACKPIAGAVMRAVRGLEAEADGYDVSMASIEARYLRDPSGEHSHGIVSLILNVDGGPDA